MMNKELIKKYFECGDFPTEEDFAELIDSSLGVLDSMGELPDANETTLGTEYKVGDNYVKCVFESGSYSWKTIGAVVPTSNYEDLENKPAIDGKILSKSTKSSDLDLISLKGNYQSIKPNTEDFVYIFKNGSVFYSKVSDLLNSSNFQEVIELETMTSTAPPITDAIEGKTKYYNTGESKIYVATSETSWSEEGEIPTDEKLYINKSNNSLYRYNGAMLAIGGGGAGGGHSIIDMEDNELPQQPKLKFEGNEVVDDPETGETIVKAQDSSATPHLKKNIVSDFVSAPGAPIILTKEEHAEMITAPEGFIEIDGEKLFAKYRTSVEGSEFDLTNSVYGSLPNELSMLAQEGGYVVPENQPYWFVDVDPSFIGDEGFDAARFYLFAAKESEEVENYGWGGGVAMQSEGQWIAQPMPISSMTIFKSPTFQIEETQTFYGLENSAKSAESELDDINAWRNLFNKNLLNAIFVGETVSTTEQTGSLYQPFATLKSAVEHAKKERIANIVLFPGEYNELIDLSDTHINIHGLLLPITRNSGTYTHVVRVVLDHIVTNENSRILFHNCVTSCTEDVTINGSNFELRNSHLYINDSTLIVNAAFSYMYDCTAQLYNSTGDCDIEFLNAKAEILNCDFRNTRMRIKITNDYMLIANTNGLIIADHTKGNLDCINCRFANYSNDYSAPAITSTANESLSNQFRLERCTTERSLFGSTIDALGDISKTGTCSYIIRGCYYDTENSTLNGTGTIE